MCGRYYIAEGFEDEIRRVCRKIDQKTIRKGDVTPAMEAPVIRSIDREPTLSVSQWGFSNQHGLMINARAESARQKPMFARCVTTGRCVIPASGFYEWNHNKDKFQFYSLDEGRLLYMAGLYRYTGTDCQHVILTTEANESMQPVHDRMPLILTEAQISIWLNDSDASDPILCIKPQQLGKYTENEQLTFKFD